MFCFSWFCVQIILLVLVCKVEKKAPDGWLGEGWMTLFVWNSAEAECTVLLPFRVTDMERAKKDSETLCAVFGWLGLRSFFPSVVACNVCSACLVLPKGHINGGSQPRLLSLFSNKKCHKSPSQHPRKDLIQPLWINKSPSNFLESNSLKRFLRYIYISQLNPHSPLLTQWTPCSKI